MSEVDSEQSETTQQTWVDEPMPEASLTSKRVREPEEGEEKHSLFLLNTKGIRKFAYRFEKSNERALVIQ